MSEICFNFGMRTVEIPGKQKPHRYLSHGPGEMILIVTVADKFPMVTHQKKPLKIRALPHDLADFSDNVIRITHGIIVGAVPS